MSYTEAQKRASIKYLNEKTDDIRLRVKAGLKGKYQKEAEKRGMSMTKFIVSCVEKEISVFPITQKPDCYFRKFVLHFLLFSPIKTCAIPKKKRPANSAFTGISPFSCSPLHPAASGTRTHTVAHWHLKPTRLPIPPWPLQMDCTFFGGSCQDRSGFVHNSGKEGTNFVKAVKKKKVRVKIATDICKTAKTKV